MFVARRIPIIRPMAQGLLSNKLRRDAETRFRRSVRVQHPTWPRKVRELRVTELLLGFEAEMRTKPEELKKLELEIRGFVAPPPLIASLKDVGREQLQQKKDAEARKIVLATR